MISAIITLILPTPDFLCVIGEAPPTASDFARVGRRLYVKPEVLIDEFSAGETNYSSQILGLGHSVAIGEEKYLISQLETNLKPEGVLRRANSQGSCLITKTWISTLPSFRLATIWTYTQTANRRFICRTKGLKLNSYSASPS